MALILVVANVLQIVLLVTAAVLLAVSVPKFMVHTLILSSRHRATAPSSWHNFWGLQRANLIFFPERLDEIGKEHRSKAISALIRCLLAAILAFIGFVIG